MTISILCPGCITTYPADGILDFGYLPTEGLLPQGVTEATLGLDCPGCSTHVDLKFTAAWRAPT